MIIRYENNCVFCSNGCRHCGRDKDYPVHACNRCRADDEKLYKWDGEELCLDCIIEDLDLEEIEYGE